VGCWGVGSLFIYFPSLVSMVGSLKWSWRGLHLFFPNVVGSLKWRGERGFGFFFQHGGLLGVDWGGKIYLKNRQKVRILAAHTLFSIHLFVFVRKRQMTHPGSESSKVIALRNETVEIIEEQLLDNKQGVCHTVALLFTFKNILRHK
jgi:hypothetical protein